MDQDNSDTEPLQINFNVDSGLLLELGERLVSRPSIALSELVKNSYDADATLVTIQFNGVKEPGGTIVVEDNGEGMAFETFRSTWMLIATEEKRRHPLSDLYRRPRTGSKGLGRFACRGLANKLTVETVAKRGKRCERTVASFEWKKFKPGIKVNEVPVECFREQVSESTQTGTRLILADTRSSWSEEDLAELQNDVLSLISPFPWELEMAKKKSPYKDPGFHIRILAPEYPQMRERGELVSEHFLGARVAKLEGHLNSAGIPSYEVEFPKLGKTHKWAPDLRFRSLGAASFVVYFYVYKSDYFSEVDFGVRDAQSLGRKFGGVRIYLDDFRVFPYGEPGEDWLRLDADRSRRLTTTPKYLLSEVGRHSRPLLLLPSNSQIFGATFLSRTRNRRVELNVTRNRLLENQAYVDLRAFVRAGIDWMTVKYAGTLVKRKKKRVVDIKELLNSIKREIEEQETTIERGSYARMMELTTLAENALESERARKISEISMLRVLASTGTMIDVFAHELGMVLRRLRQVVERLQAHLTDLPREKRAEFQENIANLLEWTEGVDHMAKLVGLLMGRESREKKRNLPLKQVVDELFDSFRGSLKELGISYSSKGISPNLRTPPMFKCELEAILINLLTNSIKAVRYRGIRSINIQAKTTPEGLEIMFLDSGPGVPKERWDDVFQPFVSESVPDTDFGQGTGLGLAIVRDLVESYGGSVGFTDPPENWGACVRIIMPGN